MAVKNIFKKIASGASKAASKASSKAKKAYKAATKKKKVITKKQYTQRGSTTGRKSKYGTKGSSKGWAAFNKTQGGKTAGKGTKGGKKSILDKNINPFKGEKTIRGAGQSIKGVVNWARKNPVDAIVYGAAGNWAGKKLGLWGGKKSKNTPEVPKMEKRNYIPKSNNKSIERTGGPIKAYGGRKAPAMKSGGGLKYVNGKWVRN